MRDHAAHWRIATVFQSAPGTSAGRCRMPGCGSMRQNDVSIRARHECRAMPDVRVPSGRRLDCFNPRPARVPGDARCRRRSPCQNLRFQSAPGTSAGRCRVSQSTLRTSHIGFNPRPARVPGDASLSSKPIARSTHRFQSAPGTSAGRCCHLRQAIAGMISVSIRARHECRAMPADSVRHSIAHDACFNPRPARVPGDASVSPISSSAQLHVSIRARHECRAMHLAALRNGADHRLQHVSIRARHECRAMPAAAIDSVDIVSDVSIRARHECRAMPMPLDGHGSAGM